jgi:hypothetical protein
MGHNLPDRLTVLLLSRPAIDKRYQNRGVGRTLLRDAMIRAINVARDGGVFAILVYAISDLATQFYLARGLAQSPLQPMTVLMTIETMRSVLSEPFAATIGIKTAKPWFSMFLPTARPGTVPTAMAHRDPDLKPMPIIKVRVRAGLATFRRTGKCRTCGRSSGCKTRAM